MNRLPLLPAADATFDALPFVRMITPFQSSEPEKHPLVFLNALSKTQRPLDSAPALLGNEARLKAAQALSLVHRVCPDFSLQAPPFRAGQLTALAGRGGKVATRALSIRATPIIAG